jgi:hypothetical protein
MAGIELIVERPDDIPVDVFESAMEDFLSLLMVLTPVDTGNCVNSWSIDISEDSATATNDAEYASFLDDGWSQQAPDGMTEPALAELPDMFNHYLNSYY